MAYNTSFFERERIIPCDDPLKEIWTTLSFLSDVPVLKKNTPVLNECDLIKISLLLRQALEFHNARNAVSIHTKPLLVYYSFLALSKAMIKLILNKDEVYHGLCQAKPGNDLMDFTTMINTGVFSSLLDISGFCIPNRTVLTLRDFFRNSYELSQQLLSIEVDKPNLLLVPQISRIIPGYIDLEFTITKDLNPDVIKSRMMSNHQLTLNFQILSEAKYHICFRNKVNLLEGIGGLPIDELENCEKILLCKSLDKSIPMGQLFFNANEDNVRMPQIAAYYGLMFILGSIVRYEPEVIASAIDNHVTGLRSFLERAIDYAIRAFPNIIISTMTQTRMEFTTRYI